MDFPVGPQAKWGLGVPWNQSSRRCARSIKQPKSGPPQRRVEIQDLRNFKREIDPARPMISRTSAAGSGVTVGFPGGGYGWGNGPGDREWPVDPEQQKIPGNSGGMISPVPGDAGCGVGPRVNRKAVESSGQNGSVGTDSGEKNGSPGTTGWFITSVGGSPGAVGSLAVSEMRLPQRVRTRFTPSVSTASPACRVIRCRLQ
jgi:hypothetical protein